MKCVCGNKLNYTGRTEKYDENGKLKIMIKYFVCHNCGVHLTTK